jgi:hypothetical protein
LPSIAAVSTKAPIHETATQTYVDSRDIPLGQAAVPILTLEIAAAFGERWDGFEGDRTVMARSTV